MMSVNKKLVMTVMVAVAPFLLTGCFKFSMHLTINKNGTADMELIMAAPKELVAIGTGLGSSIFEEKREQLDGQGFAVSDYSEEKMAGFRATKRIQSVEDFASLGLGDEIGLGGREIFTVEKGVFFTTYNLNATIDFGDQFGEESETMALFSPDLRFILTLPVKPLEHNAASVSDGGKTVEWKLSPTEANVIKLSVRAPRGNAIAAGIILGAVLLGLIPAAVFIRKRAAGAQGGGKR